MFSFPDLKRFRRKSSPPIIVGPSTDVAEVEVLPPPVEAAPPPSLPSLMGYLGERSTRHIAGWVYDPADPAVHQDVEVVCTLPGAERVVARGRADKFTHVLSLLEVGDGTHGFRMVFPEPLTEAEREHLEVRPVATGLPLQLDPALQTRWEPIRFVAMDIVNNCNLRCPFCVYDYEGVNTTKVMTDEIFDGVLKLLPLIGPECLWLSCLHEPTMHPKFTDFITRIPREHRHKIFYTSNFARRMPNIYYDTLAESGIRHVNISIESRDPAIYERMRKGARHRIFMESWEKLLAACASGSAPPKLRYIIMAYKSNFREIPELVEYLRAERMAYNVEVRHTFDEKHIPADFKASEYLEDADWHWLQAQLAHYSGSDLAFWPPPGFVGSADGAKPMKETPSAPTSEFDPRFERVPGLFQAQIFYDGFMAVAHSLAGASPRGREQFVHTNVLEIGDPVDFLMSLP